MHHEITTSKKDRPRRIKRTLLTEIETRVNNRPLTYIHENLNEVEALTPNHLITGRRIEPIPAIVTKKVEDPDFLLANQNINADNLRRKFNNVSKILKQWNRIWKDEYLSSLRETYYGANPKINQPPLKVGDIVIIDTDTPRSNWPLGKIVSLHPDGNGSWRTVKVLSRGIMSLRTIDKLIPMEISENNASLNSDVPQSGESQPRRLAAVNARQRWQSQI